MPDKQYRDQNSASQYEPCEGMAGQLRQSVQDHGNRSQIQENAGYIQRDMVRMPLLRFFQNQHDRQAGQYAGPHGKEENRPPSEIMVQLPAKHRSERKTEIRQRDRDSHHSAADGRRKNRGDQSHGGGEDHGCAESLHSPADQQYREIGRHSAEKGCSGKNRRAAQKKPFLSVQVGNPAEGHGKSSGKQQKNGDHPSHTDCAGGKSRADGGDGQVQGAAHKRCNKGSESQRNHLPVRYFFCHDGSPKIFRLF